MFVYPSALTRRYTYDSHEGLYQDHLGRRVVADFEGRGRFQVHQAGNLLTVETDDFATQETSSWFENSLVIVGQGDTDVSLATFETFQPTALLHRRGILEGRGWLWSLDGPALVDGELVLPDEITPDFPKPFFRSIVGNSFQISELGHPARLIDAWSLSDPTEAAARQWKSQNQTKLRSVQSIGGDGTFSEAMVIAHLNVGRWISPTGGCRNFILRRLYDRFHGRQRARVHVNGINMGWWYEPKEDRDDRLAWTQFGFELATAEETMEIAIDPPAGASLWSVSRYELFGW